MKKIIIAEKPDVMKKFIRALEPSAKSVCFASPYVYYYEGNQFIFASACGHLFQLKTPEEISSDNEKWSTHPLVLPEIIPLKPIKSTQQYFNCIKKLISRKDIDEVVVCTDPDREGQLIWALIARHLKINVPVTRVWIKEWTQKGLSNAFNTRQPNKNYQSLENAGLCRLQSDYIIGMTGTRVNTVCFGGYKNTINEGRVQSPTRFLVANLEDTIKNFKPEAYSVISLDTTSDDMETPLLLSSQRLTPSDAKLIASKLPKHNYLMKKEVKKVSKGCPMLYKTNDILVDAANKLSFPADKTTNILQKLYQDYGLTTYPRTEINQISVSSAKEVMKVVHSLDGAGLVDDIIHEIKVNHYTFQKHLIDTKGGEMPHEAITPTFDGKPKTILSKLSADELKVYELIVKRFLQGFYPPARLEETKVSTSVQVNGNEYPFSTSGKMIIEANWMKINGIPKDNILPSITDGNIYDYVFHQLQNKKTKPPTRFTEGKLLDAMENAGRYVEDNNAKNILKQTKGIGTGATRNAILENLYKSGFLVKKGKTIYPTEKCMQWMSVTPSDSPLKSPLMTAELEDKLSQVESGLLSVTDFLKQTNQQVDDLIKAALKAPRQTISSQTITTQEELGKCPFCGKSIKENSKSYYCTGFKDGCTFSIWKTIAGKKITKATAKTLINKGVTSKLKGFTSKAGKPFEAKLIINENTKKIEFKF